MPRLLERRRSRTEFAFGLTLFAGLLLPAASAQPLHFTNVTAASGIVYNATGGMGMGASSGDYDGDGWLDLCLVGSAVQGVALFRNNQDGTFTDVTALALPPAMPKSGYAAFADLDNDGDQDLVLSRWHGGQEECSLMFLENAAGAFAYTANPEMGRHASRVGGLTLADADRDGDLDVVMTHYYGPGVYAENLGNMVFRDATARFGAGLGVERRHWGAVFADYNNDRLVDLHIAVDFAHDYQARNLGAGIFADVSVAARVSNIGADMGLAVGDIDNDGDLDIYSTNVGVHCLYINDGQGVFSSEASSRGCAFVENANFAFAWGCDFADFDHDGDLDLAMVTESGAGSLYANDGTGHFSYATSGTGLVLGGYGLLVWDYDRDGDLDMLTTSANLPPILFENTTTYVNRHSLDITPRGTISNRDGVGTRIYVRVGATTMMREITCGRSFYCEPPLNAHFGSLAPVADEVLVIWPSGRYRRLTNVAMDQSLEVVEPRNGPSLPPRNQFGGTVDSRP